jgi:Rnl2 family RNA ligase
VDEFGIKCAKRKEILQPNDDFFNYQHLLEKLAHTIKLIHSIVKSKHQFERLSIYGEICGGEYPHPKVQAHAEFYAIQTGIYYAPNIEFYAFDIAIEQNNDFSVRNYLDYQESLEIFEKVNILHAQPLYIGKFSKAIDFDININSKIPQQLGLPQLSFDNKIEGVVIKPIKTILIETPKGKIRPILKKKNPAFSEDKRYHQAKKWTIPFNNNELDDVNFLIPEILLFLTENRLHNTRSKFGEMNNEDRIKEILDALVVDVLESFNEEYEGLLDDISEKSKSIIIQRLQTEAQHLINSYKS